MLLGVINANRASSDPRGRSPSEARAAGAIVDWLLIESLWLVRPANWSLADESRGVARDDD